MSTIYSQELTDKYKDTRYMWKVFRVSNNGTLVTVARGTPIVPGWVYSVKPPDEVRPGAYSLIEAGVFHGILDKSDAERGLHIKPRGFIGNLIHRVKYGEVMVRTEVGEYFCAGRDYYFSPGTIGAITICATKIRVSLFDIRPERIVFNRYLSDRRVDKIKMILESRYDRYD